MRGVGMEFFEKIGIVKSAEERVKMTVTVDEAAALIRYASENGIGMEGNELAGLSSALYLYQRERSLDAHQNMLENYARLARLTHPKNGRIILENSKTYMYIKAPLVLTAALVLTVMFSEALGLWLADQPEPEGGWLLRARDVQKYLLDYLSPFVWGGIGACVYLLKRLYDIAQEGCFDSTKFHGWYIRVLLGAILGTIVFHLYDLGVGNGNAMNIDAKALAFFTGLGVKVVYGAFEKTVEVLAEKLNLGAVRHSRQGLWDTRAYLSKKAGEVDSKAEPEKHRVLTELLEDLDRRPKQGESEANRCA